MSKRQSQPVVMPKQKRNTIIIKIGKIAIGHQASTHQVHDSRLKRQRTRQTQRSEWHNSI